MAEHAEEADTEWVFAAEAAERLGVTTRTVVVRSRRGDLEARKHRSGRWLVRLPVLSAIAAQAPRRGTLSADEAVALAGALPRVFWSAVYQRRLRVLRRGTELRFDPDDVAAWLDTQRVAAGRRDGASQLVDAPAGEELLTFEAAAKRLGVAPATFWRWLNTAGLPFVLAPGVRQRSVRHVRASDLERLAHQRDIELRPPR